MAEVVLNALWETSHTGPLSNPWSSMGGHGKSRPDLTEPDLQLCGVISANRDNARYFAAAPGMSFYSILQRPKAVGTLTIRSADPLIPPALDPAYFSDSEGADLATIIDGCASVERSPHRKRHRSLICARLRRRWKRAPTRKSRFLFADIVNRSTIPPAPAVWDSMQWRSWIQRPSRCMGLRVCAWRTLPYFLILWRATSAPLFSWWLSVPRRS
jgi:hypothetical protein